MVSGAEIEQAAALIRSGRLVAFPTETVYGLGANALDEAAVRRVFEVKGRPPTSPLIVHVDSIEMARGLASQWPEQAQALGTRFWPGPLTLVLPRHPSLPAIVTAGLQTVGLRVPAHPVALALIRAAGVPVAAPSANRFGCLSPTTAQHVRQSLGDAVDLILDAGPTTVGVESTVISLAGKPRLLRPGMILREQIEQVIGPIEAAAEVGAEDPHPSPGMHARHYSPTTPLLLVRDGRLPAGRVCYMWIRRPAPAARLIRMPAQAATYAATLYSTLHMVDSEGWDYIAVEEPPHTDDWEPVLDRLRRAAGLRE